jgi:hypothetical protein
MGDPIQVIAHPLIDKLAAVKTPAELIDAKKNLAVEAIETKDQIELINLLNHSNKLVVLGALDTLAHIHPSDSNVQLELAKVISGARNIIRDLSFKELLSLLQSISITSPDTSEVESGPKEDPEHNAIEIRARDLSEAEIKRRVFELIVDLQPTDYGVQLEIFNGKNNLLSKLKSLNPRLETKLVKDLENPETAMKAQHALFGRKFDKKTQLELIRILNGENGSIIPILLSPIQITDSDVKLKLVESLSGSQGDIVMDLLQKTDLNEPRIHQQLLKLAHRAIELKATNSNSIILNLSEKIASNRALTVLESINTPTVFSKIQKLFRNRQYGKRLASVFSGEPLMDMDEMKEVLLLTEDLGKMISQQTYPLNACQINPNSFLINQYQSILPENTLPDLLAQISYEFKNKLWIDLFNQDEYKLGPENLDLSNLILKYHSVLKTDFNLLTDRIQLLKQIASLAQKKLRDLYSQHGVQNTKLFHALYLVFQTSMNKRQYLSQLTQLPIELNKHFHTTSQSEFSHLLSYATKNGYLSEIFEHLDPAHRYGYILLDFEKQFTKEVSKPSLDVIPKEQMPTHVQNFFMWLENQNLVNANYWDYDYRHPEQRQVIFHNEMAYTQQLDELEKAISIEGRKYYPVWNKDHTTEGRGFEYHYNIDETGNLIIRRNGPHSTVNEGRTSLSAGMITFRNGKILSIDNNSGHYRPTKQNLENAVKKLKEKYGESIFDDKFKEVFHKY